ncbi:efflux RND transporter periplasmic adaptor subunit [Corynebacterium imitans]|uniref:efflux RND transporter periplasmic adaptor subunit n=1 Tax=Corynebacterium imitans TaxID=156978 RepID=UPI00254FC489|nr:efflux RND transporter periplasmic adaptor subunit [Corynebacterium imitans]MDK8305730.1 efflux RND transporter periplasmic adaptor subunit [Corynebacterium imitans]MDK8636804.1 efflux RND transporter periplasmic adaptor subunit [Corynebacterium imitans]MDK8772419.1 efflux RND transporter periplasmic adaptor subunit [Corynebacterium imitans]
MSEFGTTTPHATPRRRSLKLRTVAALTSVALLASACGFGGSDEADGSGLQPGDYTIAAAEDVSDSVIVNGHIAPIRAMNITTSVQSEVEKIAVQPGDRVQKDQFLASMNTEQLDRQLAAQERQQANAQAEAAQALEQAQSQLNAHDQSVANGSNQTIRQAQAQVNQAQAAYDAALAAQGGRSATRVADVFSQMAGNLSSHLPGNSSNGTSSGGGQGPKAPSAPAPVAPGGAPAAPGAAPAPGGAAAGMSPDEIAQIAGAEGGGAPMSVDEAYAALQDAKAALAAAQSQAQQERQQLQGQVDSARRQAESAGISESDGTLEYQLQEATLYSPLAGVVTSVDVEEGDIPQGKLLSLADDSSLLIKSEVREADVPNIKQGNRVEFTSTATGDKKFKGRVKRIAPAADQSSAAPAGMPGGMSAGGGGSDSESGSVTFPVEIEVTGDTKGLLLGGTVRAEIITQESADALNVPLDAVYGEEGDKKVLVMATDGDDASSGVVEERKVETGASNDVDIAITGGELKAGDIVINWPDEYSEQIGEKVSISDPRFDPEQVREAKEGKPKETDTKNAKKDDKQGEKKDSKKDDNAEAADSGEDK